MNLSLVIFFILYSLFFYKSFIQQNKKQYVHSNCQLIKIIDEIKKQGQQNNKKQSYQQQNGKNIIDCIACMDFSTYANNYEVKVGKLQFYNQNYLINKLQSKTQSNQNKIKFISANILYQTQCFQYQCSQLHYLNDIGYNIHQNKNKLNNLGFHKKNNHIFKSNNFQKCHHSQNQNQKHGNCLQLDYDISNHIKQQSKQLNNNIMNKQKVYGFLMRYRYQILSQNNINSDRKEQTQQLQPISIYFSYKQFSFYQYLILALIGGILIAFNSAFFIETFIDNLVFFGFLKQKGIMSIFYLILISQYCILTIDGLAEYDLTAFSTFLQSIFIFFYFRILLQSQRANSICANIFCFLLASFWALSPIILPQYHKIIYIIYALTFSTFQFYFMSFYSLSVSSKILYSFNNLLIISSILYLFLRNQSQNQLTLMYLTHIPYIQMILLVGAYESKSSINNEESMIGGGYKERLNRNQKVPQYQQEDIQLRINKQLGY